MLGMLRSGRERGERNIAGLNETPFLGNSLHNKSTRCLWAAWYPGRAGMSGGKWGSGCSHRKEKMFLVDWIGCVSVGLLWRGMLSHARCWHAWDSRFQVAIHSVRTLSCHVLGVQVAAWRARGRLPLGVDITACLLQTKSRYAGCRPASQSVPALIAHRHRTVSGPLQ
jgi:hypothetical protein